MITSTYHTNLHVIIYSTTKIPVILVIRGNVHPTASTYHTNLHVIIYSTTKNTRDTRDTWKCSSNSLHVSHKSTRNYLFNHKKYP